MSGEKIVGLGAFADDATGPLNWEPTGFGIPTQPMTAPETSSMVERGAHDMSDLPEDLVEKVARELFSESVYEGYNAETREGMWMWMMGDGCWMGPFVNWRSRACKLARGANGRICGTGHQSRTTQLAARLLSH